ASTTQIVPICVGEAEPTMDLCERALERGVFAQGIRPPTVPEGSSRLRFTVMATHEPEELRQAAHQVGEAAREIGLLKSATIAAVEAAVGADRTPGLADADPGATAGARTWPSVVGLPDPATLRAASLSPQTDAEIAPYRFDPPMSPHLAAGLAGVEIDPE